MSDKKDGVSGIESDQANASVLAPESKQSVTDDDGCYVSQGASCDPDHTSVPAQRPISPPNSVKAFAKARHRGRESPTSENETVQRLDAKRHSTVSVESRNAACQCAARATTSDSVKENACSPIYSEQGEDRLYIDYDVLEALAKSETRHERAVRVFPDLRKGSRLMSTADEQLLNTLPDQASSQEKGEDSVHSSTLSQQRHADATRFSFFSSAWLSTLHAANFGALVLPGEDIRCLFHFPEGEGGGVWWLNISNPTEEEVRAISKAFRIHPLTTEDIITQEHREKIELFPSYYFGCFRTFRSVEQSDGVHYIPCNICVVVFREGLLSFNFADNIHAPRVLARISRLEDFVALSSDWICYALIDDVVDSFAPVIYQVQHEADTIEDQIFATRPDDGQEFLRRIGMARKKTMVLMRILGGKADVLRGFMKRCNEKFNVTPRKHIALYLGDIQDHAVTMMNSLIHFDRMLSRSHSNYLAQLSIDNTAQSNRIKDTLKRVTVIATVLVPLVVVCTLFGMNVRVPWQDVNNVNAFLGIVGGISLFALTFLVIARRMRYI